MFCMSQLRQSIDALQSQLKELPSRLRHYASYEHVRRTLQSYSKVGKIFSFGKVILKKKVLHIYRLR